MTKGKVCLAYSGGLDTSCILRWLIEEGYDVVACLVDVGVDEDFKEVESKGLKVGAKKVVIEDCQKEFIEELCFRAIQCNARYEERYLLGTALARPVITRALMRVAKREGCDYISHGATGKGNDNVRFELGAYALSPRIGIIAPWRERRFFERFQGRNDLLEYAAKTGIPVKSTKAKPYSEDSNAAHCSYEAGILEDPDQTAPDDIWTLTEDPLKDTNEPTKITITFEKGIPVKLVTPTETITDSVKLFKEANRIGKIHGIGRIDIVEDRYFGSKSRGCYDSPGMTILREAHLDLEGLTMDLQVRNLRDQFVTHTWTNCLYNGLYFSPERAFVEHCLLAAQECVNGEVRLRCARGLVQILGRSSKTEKLYSQEEASMDSLENFNPEDTTGFIKIQSVRLKKHADKWAL